jgi:hypothetical protein
MIKTRRKSATAFLRKLISPYGYGTKDILGYRRPTNDALVQSYNTWGYIRGLTNAQMLAHFEGRSTHYFWADGRIKTPFALICIDIDNHRFGTLAAAIAFAQYLRDTFFPDLYFEPSTGGKGVHCYLIIDKREYGAHYLHGRCRLLDQALKSIHREWQFKNLDKPVEGVEIKGHPPQIAWTNDGKMKEFTSGQFAKLPREMLTRFGEFSKTTVLTNRQINELYRQYKDHTVILSLPDAEDDEPCASLTGCAVKKADLDRWEAYLALARKLVPTPLQTSGREVAVAEDMAILLLNLEACTRKMNADGSMPTARIRENWEILHANRLIKRPWVSKRYTALRNHLSQEGLLHWDDPHYVPGTLSPTGKGRAARWCASEALMERIEEEKLKLIQGPDDQDGEGDVDKREREEDLYGDNTDLIPSEETEPDWIIDLRRANFVQPVLDPGIWLLRMAC